MKTLRRLLAASLAMMPGIAVAEPTLLHLSATGTVQAMPDRLVAEFSAEASSADVAAAQMRVDRTMQQAQRLAAGAGVHGELAGYAADHEEARPGEPASWTARQMLRLDGADAARLLDLAGRLQKAGLALQSLSWVLSPPRLTEAQAEASDLALKSLRTRADAAARALGLRTAGFRDVTLGQHETPRPFMMRTMATAAPQATQDTQDVSEEASAIIVLQP